MLKELSTQHREIARLSFEGLKPAAIASRLSIPVSTVRSILKDALCQAHIRALQDRADTSVIGVRKRLAAMTAKALDAIDDLLDPANEVPAAVVFGAAKDVLDRNGFAPAQQINHAHSFFTLDDLRELQARAKAQGAALSDPNIVDVTPLENVG